MKGFDAIVFDYDGTLFDTRPAIIHCVQRAFEECGRPVGAPAAVTNAVNSGLPLQDTLALLDGKLRADRSALNALVTTYRLLYRDEGSSRARPFPGVKAALEELGASGAKILVVSNKGIAAIHRSLDQSGLSPLVDLVFGDERGLPKKPDPAIVTGHILPRYPQLQPEQVLIVGDTEIDILLARRSGVSCCWASYGYGETERCRALKPEHEISGIEELPAIARRS